MRQGGRMRRTIASSIVYRRLVIGATCAAAEALGMAPAGPAAARPAGAGCAADPPTHDHPGQALAVARGTGHAARDGNELAGEQAAALDRDLGNALARRQGHPATRRQRADEELAPGSVNIPVYFHIITSGSAGRVADDVLTRQIDVLRKSFAGETGGAATPFTFTLAEARHVDNSGWYAMQQGSAGEQAMKDALHQGGPNALNIYVTGLSRGLLGWATWPNRAGTKQDGVVLLRGALP